MALPTSVTAASAALVVAAGIGLAAIAGNADDSLQPAAAPPVTTPATTAPPTTAPVRQLAKPRRDAVPKVFVEVYNNSGIKGLAADRAAVLSGAGWNVAATDNWYGNIAADTVYFPPGKERQARQLAKILHITRLRPAVTPMNFDRLTVIFTAA